MFTTFIVQPLFNLLVLIYALLPGHNFGLALIVFTVVIRLLMWPLVKKQLHHTKITRALQPELRRIKQDAKGDRQKESMMMMALYKERGVNPFGVFPTLILQMIILFGLYAGLNKIIKDPHQIVQFAYQPLQNLSWMEHVAQNIRAFDNSLFGLVDLSRPALSAKGLYLPAFALVVGSAAIQFVTSRQLLPSSKDTRRLRDILKDASEGKQADQTEMSAAISRNMQYIIPFMVFVTTIYLAAALSLYWLVGGVIAYFQQAYALREEEEDMEKLADSPDAPSNGSATARPRRDVRRIAEAEVVGRPSPQQPTKTHTTTAPRKRAKKRRR